MPHDHNHDHPHHESHGGGFMLGVIVGAVLMFLLATKKGKKILKVLTDNGFEGISEITDLFDEEDDLDEEAEYTAEGPVSEKVTPAPERPARTLKRFFRGVRK